MVLRLYQMIVYFLHKWIIQAQILPLGKSTKNKPKIHFPIYFISHTE